MILNCLFKRFDSILSAELPHLVYDATKTMARFDKEGYSIAKMARYSDSKEWRIIFYEYDDVKDKVGKKNGYYCKDAEIDDFIRRLEDAGYEDITEKQLNLDVVLNRKYDEDVSAPEFMYEAAGNINPEALLERLEALSLLEDIEKYKDLASKVNQGKADAERVRDVTHITETFLATLETIEECRRFLEEIQSYKLQKSVKRYIGKVNKALMRLYRMVPSYFETQISKTNYLLHTDSDVLIDADYHADDSPEEIKTVVDGRIQDAAKELDLAEARTRQALNRSAPPVMPDNIEVIKKIVGDNTLIISKATKSLVENVKNLLGVSAHRFVNCWKVVNPETEAAYKANREGLKGDHRKEQLLWHGTKTGSWVPILKEGLKIMPNATNGRMFGDGLYFATDAGKSALYTSAKGSKYGEAFSDSGFLAIYKVRTGNSLIVDNSKQRENLKRFGGFKWNVEKDGEYDSLTGKASPGFLKRDEIVVYDVAQCTIYALVEIAGKDDQTI